MNEYGDYLGSVGTLALILSVETFNIYMHYLVKPFIAEIVFVESILPSSTVNSSTGHTAINLYSRTIYIYILTMLWLVTGCSTGLGLEIARAVLKAGQKCIATSRNPSKSPHEVAEIPNLGGAWAQLDVSGPNVEADIEKIIAEHGTVDVVVNNAGYADGGILETMR